MQIGIQRDKESGMIVVDFNGHEYRLSASPEACTSFADHVKAFVHGQDEYSVCHLDLADTPGGEE